MYKTGFKSNNDIKCLLPHYYPFYINICPRMLNDHNLKMKNYPKHFQQHRLLHTYKGGMKCSVNHIKMATLRKSRFAYII